MSRSKYNFNFFKPKSEYAKSDARLITSILIVWFLAVFGFHILLKAIEEPVPEPQLVRFEEVWTSIMDRTANQQELRDVTSTHLNLLSRHVSLRSNETFKLSLTSMVYRVLPRHKRSAFLRLTKKDLSERKAGAHKLATSIGLEKDGILAQVLPYGLVPFNGKRVSSEVLETIPPIMRKNMVHYRSVLTDTKFLGFPFHYFYTSIFLLILFIGLCWIYCKKFDEIAKTCAIKDEKGIS
ncbi:MAG: DUF4212 domain-containing protein [Alphaproteobacteria bacterium]|nr:DUF4212 domain-containing protein [Alphaproteobacteria bacterium]